MTSRLLYGIAACAFVGLIWTSVPDRDTPVESQDDGLIERTVSTVENRPARTGTRAGAVRNPGGLPARDRSAGDRRQPTPVASGAASGAARSVPTAHSSQPASIGVAAARGVRAASVSAALTHEPSVSGDAVTVPEAERPRSRGIGGSVLEKSGAPAAGLAVGLKPRRIFSGAASSPLRTTTDGRGNFAFNTVADGEYEIRTEKDDRYESASALVRAGTDSAVLVVEAISGNIVSIHGVVESANGAPLDGVRISVLGASITAVTNAKGAYALRLPAGARLEQTTLQFRRTGYRDRRWVISDGLRASDFDVIGNVRLDPDAAGVRVNGMVTSAAGAPVARAQVQLTSAERGRNYRAVTDGGGRFTIASVEAGTDYRVWARAQSGFKDGVLENVIVDAGATAIDVALTPIGVATLRGRMVTPDGAPVPGFSMFLTAASGTGARSLMVTSDGQGRFLAADLPEGRVALQTRAVPAISVSGIELSAARPDTDVTVVVDVGARRFDGQLLTSDAGPAAGVTVSLEWSASNGGVISRSSRQTTTDADGNFAFTQLGGGLHIVSATLAGAGSVRLERSVGTGVEPVQITFPGKRGYQ